VTLIVAEYECPVHGRFELTVERDANGDAPAKGRCPRRVVHGGASVEYRPGAFPSESVLKRLNERCEVVTGCSDGYESPWVISAPMGRVSPFSMVTGRSDPRPSDRHVMDTSKLADGMPISEFKAERAKVHRDESLRRVRKAIGRGPKTYVGGK